MQNTYIHSQNNEEKRCVKMSGLLSKEAITRMQAMIIAAIVVIAAISVGVYYVTLPKPKPFLTMAIWAGKYVEGITPLVESFEEETGIEVEFYIQGSSGETATKVVAEKDDPTIDLFLGGTGPIISKCVLANVCAPITEETVPNIDLMSDMALSGLPNYLGVKTLFENWIIYPDIIPEEHAYNGSIRWFFDPALEDRLAVCPPTWGLSSTFFCIMAYALELTEDPRELPENLEAGIEVAKMLAPNIRFVFASHADLQSAFAAEEIWGAVSLFSDAKASNEADVPVEALKVIPDSLTPAEWDSMMVVKGGKEDLAYEFLNYILVPERLAQFTYTIACGPMNEEPVPPSSELEPYLLAGDEMEYALATDYEINAAALDSWLEMWEAEVEPLL